MNKKEFEQIELSSFLQECINEQKEIGLHPLNNIEIYFNVDPITNFKCPNGIQGTACFDIANNRTFILVRKKSFLIMSTEQRKRLIHHELIHCNMNEDNKPINHLKDGELFFRYSKLIQNKYHISPLETYHQSCFDYNEKTINYNASFVCHECGYISHFMYDDTADNDLNKKCPNCGHQLVFKKRLV